ncbi:MAG: type II secretion system F family protein [Armatimonadota bacterium]|nr:type II secretion system F family protein [Armatimonadota bacterium]
MQAIVIGLAVFVLVALSFVLFAHLMTRRSARMRERLERYTSTPAPGASTTPADTSSDRLPTVSKFLSNKGLTETLMLEISRAGLSWRPSEYVVMIAVFTLAPIFLGLVLHVNPAMAVLAGVIGFCIPVGALKMNQARRLKAFNDQIADALSLISSSLRSGYSFMRAMQVVSTEMPAPISEEFGRVIDECNVGVPTEDALSHLVARMHSYDMELVVTAVNIQIQLGGNLAEILDTIAETIRERVRINGEIAALTADGRLSGVILIALPIFLTLVIQFIAPQYLAPLLTRTVGHYMLIGAGASMIFGALVIRKMLQIDF